ncbi:uncharacterized protein DSM5745_04359 [Aspergillus mulundensis]|uniref:F-box domain-containing protein n=1 Tax=Aspergillus mulundensis TaxID=1810919 RepID=A0A3D8SCM5_9EURO|nr:hypothetical protein DSM5745_04359 [Aspergillus mulundensis]RDW84033.1 hypothetical protein DSM5745_04359 [Aspergillus mulundensis]
MADKTRMARNKRACIRDLPQELCDKITEEAINKTVNKVTIHTLRALCRVNEQFYRSATRLLYRRVHLDFEDRGRSSLTPISIDKFSLSPHRRSVRHLMITCLRIRDDNAMVRLQELPILLARLPGLRSLSISLARSKPVIGSLSKEREFVNVLHQSLQAYGANEDSNLDTLRIFNPHIPLFDSEAIHDTFNLSRVMLSLRRFEYVDQIPMDKKAQIGIFHALQHAQKIEQIKLESLGRLQEASFSLLPDNAPLRRLELTSITLRASDLLALSKFKNVLEYLSLDHISLTEGSWAEVFHSLSTYTCLAYIEFYCYHLWHDPQTRFAMDACMQCCRKLGLRAISREWSWGRERTCSQYVWDREDWVVCSGPDDAYTSLTPPGNLHLRQSGLQLLPLEITSYAQTNEERRYYKDESWDNWSS